jgi:hypothetical protein
MIGFTPSTIDSQQDGELQMFAQKRTRTDDRASTRCNPAAALELPAPAPAPLVLLPFEPDSNPSNSVLACVAMAECMVGWQDGIMHGGMGFKAQLF